MLAAVALAGRSYSSGNFGLSEGFFFGLFVGDFVAHPEV